MILIFPLIVHFLDQILLSECRQLMRNTLNNRANRSREFGAANRLFPRQNTSFLSQLFESDSSSHKHLNVSSDFEQDGANQSFNLDDDLDDQGRFMLWLQLIALSFAILGVSFKIYVKCRRNCVADVDPEVVCYLCEKKVPLSEWNDKTNGHRNYCIVKSKDHRDLLSDMPRVDIMCHFCEEPLRIWPPNVGPPVFSCKAPLCRSGGIQVRNEGSNRLNCFRCDFDLCRDCGEEELAAIKTAKNLKGSSKARNFFGVTNGQKKDTKAALHTARRRSFNVLSRPVIEVEGTISSSRLLNPDLQKLGSEVGESRLSRPTVSALTLSDAEVSTRFSRPGRRRTFDLLDDVTTTFTHNDDLYKTVL